MLYKENTAGFRTCVWSFWHTICQYKICSIYISICFNGLWHSPSPWHFVSLNVTMYYNMSIDLDIKVVFMIVLAALTATDWVQRFHVYALYDTIYQYWCNVVYITVYLCIDSRSLAKGPQCVRPLWHYTRHEYWYLLYNVVYITVYFCFDSGWLATGPPCVRPLRQLWNVLPPNWGAVCGGVRIQHDLWDSGRIFRRQIVSIKQALVIFLDYVFLQVLYSALKNLEYKLIIFMQ